MNAKSKVNKKYELVAPDGGWGFMICVSFIINNAATTMFMGSFGLLYNDFMIQIGIASTGVTLLYGLNALFLSLSAAAHGFARAFQVAYARPGILFIFLPNSKNKKLLIKTTVIGMLASFSANKLALPFNVAVLPAFWELSLLVTAKDIRFFVSSLVKLSSLRKTAFLGVLVLNIGTFGMIFCNSYVTFVIYQGILPGIALGISFSLSCTIMNDYYVKKRIFAYSIVQFGVAAITMLGPIFVKWSLEQYGFRGTLLLISGISIHHVLGVLLMQPVEWHMKRVEVKITPDVKPLLTKEMGKDRAKVNETTVETGAASDIVQIGVIEKNKSNKRMPVEKILDIRFFVKFIKSCVCIGPALASFVEMTYIVLLPQALYSMGWDQGMVAFAIFLYCFGDMAMRIALIFTSKWILKLGSQEAYILGLVLATFGKLGMTWSEKEVPIYVYLVLIGIARCFIFVILTEVIADNVPPENFTQAIGTYMMATGFITIVIGPAIGATRDLTNSYSTAFYLLTSFFAIIILFWTIEIVYKKNKDKRNIQRETAAKSNQLNKGK